MREMKKSVVSRSRQKRGDTTSIDMTTLADRKLYTQMKPQIKIPALNLNQQVVKKAKVENKEKMFKKCKYEK
jgi:hypothetical protein